MQLGPSKLTSTAPAHALSKQVHEHYLPQLLSHDPSIHAEPTTEAEITTRNRLFNVDGFGMAWYTSTISAFSPAKTTSQQPELYPALYKSIQPPLHDSNFRSICRNTSSEVVFAHIRAATATAITPTNNHPFTFGIHTVMHNGYISDFPKIKRHMCEAMTQEAYENIQGGTDTEHFAALLISFLCPTTSTSEGSGTPDAWEKHHSLEQIKKALQQTIAKIIELQQDVLADRAEPNDLNIAITDGKVLVASRFRNHATEQPPSLYYSTQAGVTLNRQFPDHPDGARGPHGSAEKHGHVKEPAQGAEGHNPHAKRNAGEHGNHVIIASEPTTYKNKEWSLIEKNRIVLVDSHGKVDIQEI
ncbi:glutamine amidotransferase class-II [Phlyctema vagabunda]|uniref:Glutamine amidotransferase class-II n=1 Tax=Phlyctema vagabunda TaxID=108571 RepID=A0ABR4PA71_9HELO